MCELTDLPLIVKANAGLPNPETGEYSITPEQFAAQMARFVPLGVCYLGGCCGTRPDFIRQIIAETQGQSRAKRNSPPDGGMYPNRNGGSRWRAGHWRTHQPNWKKRFQQALREGDFGLYTRTGGGTGGRRGADADAQCRTAGRGRAGNDGACGEGNPVGHRFAAAN